MTSPRWLIASVHGIKPHDRQEAIDFWFKPDTLQILHGQKQPDTSFFADNTPELPPPNPNSVAKVQQPNTEHPMPKPDGNNWVASAGSPMRPIKPET